MSQVHSARAPDQQTDLTTRSRMPLLDVLLINATDILSPERRADLLQRLHLIARRTRRSSYHGPWVLVLTHVSAEHELARLLATTLTTRMSPFQGVVAVQQRQGEKPMRIAMALHRLHFPWICHKERKQYILIMGSAREDEMLQLLEREAGRAAFCLETGEVS